MAYQVFDNGMSADYSGSCKNMKRGLGWDNSRFDTLSQAIEYCLDYLGATYGKSLRDVNRTALGIMFMNGYEYSGAGGKIQIKKID